MKVPIWCLPSPYITNIWGTRQQLTKEHVSKALQRGITKSIPLLDFEDHGDVDLHAERVAYFVLNGWTDLVSVIIQFTDQKEPYCFTDEGNHRVAAKLYLEENTIDCLYNEVVEQYLRERDL